MSNITEASISITLDINLSETSISELRNKLLNKGLKVDVPSTDPDELHEQTGDWLTTYYNDSETIISALNNGEAEISDVTIHDHNIELPEEEDA